MIMTIMKLSYGLLFRINLIKLCKQALLLIKITMYYIYILLRFIFLSSRTTYKDFHVYYFNDSIINGTTNDQLLSYLLYPPTISTDHTSISSSHNNSNNSTHTHNHNHNATTVRNNDHDQQQREDDKWGKVQLYSLSLIFKLWSLPHYRSNSFQQDMLDNLKNVAVPGTYKCYFLI